MCVFKIISVYFLCSEYFAKSIFLRDYYGFFCQHGFPTPVNPRRFTIRLNSSEITTVSLNSLRPVVVLMYFTEKHRGDNKLKIISEIFRLSCAFREVPFPVLPPLRRDSPSSFARFTVQLFAVLSTYR